MPWPDEPCATCPRIAKGLPGPCRAQVTRHQRFCELARTRPDYAALLCDEAPPMPGLVHQAVAFAGAVVRHVAAGMPRATDEQAAARLAICRECEFYDPPTMRCRAAGCGCYLNEKTRWADQSCPLTPPKWGRVDT